MDDRVEIQIDNGGVWQTTGSCLNNSQIIKKEMESLKRWDPTRRVRCVDMEGRLVDLMY